MVMTQASAAARLLSAMNGICRMAWIAVVLSPVAAGAYYPAPSSSPPGAAAKGADSRLIIVRLKSLDSTAARRGPAARAAALGALETVASRFGVLHVEALFPPEAERRLPASLHGLLQVRVPDGADLSLVIAACASLDVVAYAEPDYLLSLLAAPDDPLYGHQWSLHNTGQSHYHVLRRAGSFNDSLVLAAGTAGADMHAQSMYANPPAGSVNVVVAILDTGVDGGHPELAPRIWTNAAEIPLNGRDDDLNGHVDDVHGWDFSGDFFTIPPPADGDNDPSDRHGHGTHCAGIVGALAGNGQGIAGLVTPCRIMPLKMFPAAFTSVAARAIVYAADNGADVINMSWGGPWYSRTLKEALDYARSRGVVLVAAAGNSGEEAPFYPAAYPGVIAVSATDDLDHVTDFSTFGSWIDLAAPGQSILSLRAGFTDMYAEADEPYVHIIDGSYYLASGTSMAAPHVAGAAAWLRAVSPGLVVDFVYDILTSRADDLLDPYGRGDNLPGRDPYSGFGRLNMEQALLAAPPLRAVLESPRPHQLVSGLLTVVGTAAGDPTGTFVLDYGRGPAPAEWTPLATGSADIEGGVLAVWNTDTLGGLYTLRLRLGATHAAEVKVYVVNDVKVAIAQPNVGDTIVSWVDVVGFASAPDFDSYLLEYGEGQEPKAWKTIDSVTYPVEGDKLGTWYTGDLPDGWHSLRLTLFTTTGPAASEAIPVVLRTPFSSGQGWKVPLATAEPVVLANYGDFDRDGDNEIVVGTEHGLEFFRPDGTVSPPAVSLLTTGRPVHTPVAVGDLDGDGHDDLVAVDDEGNLAGYPSTEHSFEIHLPDLPWVPSLDNFDEYQFPLVFLRDLDGDNRDEIHYFPGWNRNYLTSYFVYQADGDLVTEIPRLSPLPNRSYGAYLPADLDGDGIDELYIADAQLHLLDDAGGVRASFPLSTAQGSFTALGLSAADIDGDDKPELIVLARPQVDAGHHWIFAFDEYLLLKDGWPHDTGIEYFWSTSAPVFADIDRDGTPEYFMTWFDFELGYVSAWHLDGTPFLGQTESPVFAATPEPAKLRSPAIVDIDGDGQGEVVACATADIFQAYQIERVYAWDQAGRVLPGWPVITESFIQSAGSGRRNPTNIGDIDRDGRVDMTMVTSDNNLVLLNWTGGQVDFGGVDAPFWRYDRGLSNVAPILHRLEVTAVAPTARQLGVDPNAEVHVSFNRDLDWATIADEHLSVRGTASGDHTGTLTYDAPTRTLRWVPLVPFATADTVLVALTSDIRSTDGRPLPHGFSTSFMIEAEAPAIVAVWPLPNAVQVQTATDIAASFNTRLDPASVDSHTVTAIGSFTGRHSGTVLYDSLNRRVVFDPDEEFVFGEFVAVTLSKKVRSAWDYPLQQDYAWSFLVAYAGVVALAPEPEATHAPLDGELIVRVDQSLDLTYINDSTFVVWGVQSGRMAGVLGYDSLERTAALTPLGRFFPGEEVTATFSPAHYTWSFVAATAGALVNFADPATYALSQSPYLAAGDLDGDGDVDLCAASTVAPYIWKLLNKRHGTLARDTIYTGERVHRALLRDLDADGDLDCAAVGAESGRLLLLANLGQGEFAYPVSLALSGTRTLEAADIDLDGDLDIFTDAGDSAHLEILRNAGRGSFAQVEQVDLPLPPAGACPVDLDRDGDLDLVVALESAGMIVMQNDGEGLFSPGATLAADRSFRCPVAKDLNGDGFADLAAVDTAGVLMIFTNDGSGTLSETAASPLPGDTRALLTADLDGDGDLDLASARGVPGEVTVLLNDGNGAFAPADSYAIGDDALSLVALDLDSDGDIDLAAGGQTRITLLINAEPSSVGDDGVVPREFALLQNYPNPFNPTTKIEYTLPAPAHVRLDVFNILGQRVITLADEARQPGRHLHVWDGRDRNGRPLPSGLYFYRLEAGALVATRKMLLLK